jgi:hypothetical protein
VAYLLKARIVESQQPAITRQQSINNRSMVFSEQSVTMAAHATVEYIMPSLSNNCTATEEWCFLCSPCWSYTNLAVVKLMTIQVTKLPLYHKICKIGMICFAKPGLTEDFYKVQKKEFTVTCYKCDMFT